MKSLNKILASVTLFGLTAGLGVAGSTAAHATGTTVPCAPTYTITKTDEAGKPLSGAEFTITASAADTTNYENYMESIGAPAGSLANMYGVYDRTLLWPGTDKPMNNYWKAGGRLMSNYLNSGAVVQELQNRTMTPSGISTSPELRAMTDDELWAELVRLHEDSKKYLSTYTGPQNITNYDAYYDELIALTSTKNWEEYRTKSLLLFADERFAGKQYFFYTYGDHTDEFISEAEAAGGSWDTLKVTTDANGKATFSWADYMETGSMQKSLNFGDKDFSLFCGFSKLSIKETKAPLGYELSQDETAVKINAFSPTGKLFTPVMVWNPETNTFEMDSKVYASEEDYPQLDEQYNYVYDDDGNILANNGQPVAEGSINIENGTLMSEHGEITLVPYLSDILGDQFDINLYGSGTFVNKLALTEIATVASDKADGDKWISYKGGTIVDKLAYTNLAPGTEYTIKTTFMNPDGKETGVTSEMKYTPTTPAGVVDVESAVPASLAGQTIVIFQEIYFGDMLVGEDKDLNNLNETFYVQPEKPEATVETRTTTDYNCEDKTKEVTTITDTTDWVWDETTNEWVKDEVVTTSVTAPPVAMTADEIAAECPVEKPEPIVEVTKEDVKDCTLEEVRTVTTTTTTDWVKDSTGAWVKDEPVVTETSESRPMTQDEVADCYPAKPAPVVEVTTQEVPSCENKEVTVTKTTTTTDWVWDTDSKEWVKDTPVKTEDVSTRPMTDEEKTECPNPKPAPVVSEKLTNKTLCDSKEVETTKVITTTPWVWDEAKNDWVPGEAVVTTEVTKRAMTEAEASECKVTTPTTTPTTPTTENTTTPENTTPVTTTKTTEKGNIDSGNPIESANSGIIALGGLLLAAGFAFLVGFRRETAKVKNN